MTPEEREEFNMMKFKLNELTKDRYSNLTVFKENVEFKSNKIGFYSTEPVVQPSAVTAPSIGSVSGSGADGTINGNFASLETTVNGIRTTLSSLGITA